MFERQRLVDDDDVAGRDLLRELPTAFREELTPLAPRSFLEIAASSYASRRDRRVTPHRARMARSFQQSYLELAERAARLERRPLIRVLEHLSERSAVINRAERITGDSATYATQRLIRQRRSLGLRGLYWVLSHFVDTQDRDPERRQRRDAGNPRERRALARLIDLMAPYRYGL